MMFTYCPKCGKQHTVQKLDDTNFECKACGWHFWNNSKASVFIALVRDGNMLVSKRAVDPHKGFYDLPGGFVEFGEDCQAAAIREAREELGVTIARDDPQLIAAYHNRYSEDVYTVDIGFLVTKWQGEPTPNDKNEVEALAWKPFSFVNDPLFREAEPYYTGLDKILAQRTANESPKVQ